MPTESWPILRNRFSSLSKSMKILKLTCRRRISCSVLIFLRSVNSCWSKDVISLPKIFTRYFCLELMHKETLWSLRKSSGNFLMKIMLEIITIVEFSEMMLVNFMKNSRINGLMLNNLFMNIREKMVLK